jgi:hypothetical protein
LINIFCPFSSGLLFINLKKVFFDVPRQPRDAFDVVNGGREQGGAGKTHRVPANQHLGMVHRIRVAPLIVLRLFGIRVDQVGAIEHDTHATLHATHYDTISGKPLPERAN